MNPPTRVAYRATFLLLVTLTILLVGGMIGSSLTAGLMMRGVLNDPAVIESIKGVAEQTVTQKEYEQTLSDAMLRYRETHASLLTMASLFGTVGEICVLVLFVKCVERASLSSVGLGGKGRTLRYLGGCVLGLGMFGAAVALLSLTGAARLESSPHTEPILIASFFLAFVIQGAAEELLLRGFLMNRLRMGRSVWMAVLISSLLFGILHLPNEGAGGLAFVNVCLFGVFASLLYLVTGSLWVSMGVHTLWNFAQGNLFGCSVSGFSLDASPFRMVLAEGRDLTHGGLFGPEGGLAVTLVLLLSLALLVLVGFRTPLTKKKPE